MWAWTESKEEEDDDDDDDDRNGRWQKSSHWIDDCKRLGRKRWRMEKKGEREKEGKNKKKNPGAGKNSMITERRTTTTKSIRNIFFFLFFK